jgi:hypothetical protein
MATFGSDTETLILDHSSVIAFDFRKPAASRRVCCRHQQPRTEEMNEGWFSKVVPVAVGVLGDIRHVSNARQANDLLANHWPGAGTRKHLDAKRACLAAVNGMTTVEDARETFVEAAREARILIE